MVGQMAEETSTFFTLEGCLASPLDERSFLARTRAASLS